MSDAGSTALAALTARPALFSLVAAIEALERSVPGSAPLGRLGPAAAEALRLRPLLDLAFPNADIAALGQDGGRWLLTTTVLGLYGECSPLPTSYTEQLMALDEPNAARALLDVLNHRLLSFLYRALVKHRLHGDDHQRRFAALIGDDPAAGGERGAHSRSARLLACAGCLAHRGGSAAGLEAALAFWFTGLPVRVETCVPTWTRIADDQRSALGGGNGRLGRDTVLGEAIRNRGLAVRIEVRPRSAAELNAFLPGGAARAELAELSAAFNPARLDLQLDVLADPTHIPPAALGGGSRMAYDLRLGGDPRTEHRIRSVLAA